MKYLALATTAFAAFASFPSAAADVLCTVCTPGVSLRYTIFNVAGVEDPAGLSNGLRGNIHKFGSCLESLWDYKLADDDTWQITFAVPAGCNDGMVESAWWGATKNKYGGLDCPGGTAPVC